MKRHLAIALAVLLAVSFGFWLLLRPPAFPKRLRLGTGLKGGTWVELGDGLSRLLTDRIEGVAVEAVRTQGSVDNTTRLCEGDLDLAFLLNNSPGGKSIRMIAPLYENFLHIVVRADADRPIEEIGDLRGRAVAVGAPKSGTLTTVQALLGHFRMTEGDLDARHLETGPSIEAFQAGEVDAVFVYAALPGSPVRGLLEEGRGRLLSLGEPGRVGSVAEGFCMTHSDFRPAVIPERTYGEFPIHAVSALSVKTILACRAELDDLLVFEITRALFTNKMELAKSHVVASRLDEAFVTSSSRFLLHDGAATWIRRKDPPFFVRYADPLSFGLSILLAVTSCFLAVRGWLRKRKKDRLDEFVIEVGEVAKRVREAEEEELLALQEKLDDVRRRAFEDLVDERVRADETFNIFQSFLNSELRMIRNRLLDLERSHRRLGGQSMR